jgi:hypothetical protein
VSTYDRSGVVQVPDPAYLGVLSKHAPHQWDFDWREDVSREEFEEAQRDLARLVSFADGDLLPYVRFALGQFRAAIGQAKAGASDPSRRSIDGLAVRYSVITFLSALCMHKEQTDTKIYRRRKARWGKPLAESAGNVSSMYYDQFFGYRFCARLRNFILHERADVINAEIFRSLPNPDPVVRVYARSGELLDPTIERNHWSTVGPEIAAQSDELDVILLIEEAARGTESLATRVRLLLFPGISQSVRRMRDWRTRVGEVPSGSFPTLVFPDGPGADIFGSGSKILTLSFDLTESVAQLILEAR